MITLWFERRSNVCMFETLTAIPNWSAECEYLSINLMPYDLYGTSDNIAASTMLKMLRTWRGRENAITLILFGVKKRYAEHSNSGMSVRRLTNITNIEKPNGSLNKFKGIFQHPIFSYYQLIFSQTFSSTRLDTDNSLYSLVFIV